jgi:NAD(P)-dependent dehydrogenase (short-subunit alcohol dehydrogenase family)
MAPPSIAVVTGAGSGVGRGVVLDLARHGWQVALLGRRPAALQTTLDLAGLDASPLAAYPVDIRQPDAVRAVARQILDRFGAVDALGLAGLAQSVNAEERARGIRACAIFPGDINTPLLDKRPAPPDLAARARMLRPEDVAACVRFCLELPPPRDRRGTRGPPPGGLARRSRFRRPLSA